VNCCVCPKDIEGPAGATAIEVITLLVTVRTAVLLVILPTLAVILLVPTATEVARPLLLIVAVAGVPLFQVAEPETSPVLLSE